MSLVTVADYEELTGVDVPTADEPRVQAMLDAASAAVQRITGQTIEKARTTEQAHVREWRMTLVLDEVPLIEADPDDTLIVTGPSGDVVAREDFVVIAETSELRGVVWAPGVYEVQYTHGYDPVPADLVALIVGSVQSVMGGAPAGVASQSVGSYSVTYAPGAGTVGGAAGSVEGSPVLDGYRVPAPPMP